MHLFADECNSVRKAHTNTRVLIGGSATYEGQHKPTKCLSQRVSSQVNMTNDKRRKKTVLYVQRLGVFSRISIMPTLTLVGTQVDSAPDSTETIPTSPTAHFNTRT